MEFYQSTARGRAFPCQNSDQREVEEEPVFAFPMMNLFPDRNLLPPEASTSVVLWLASDEASTELAAPSPSMPDR
jgi:hypothetical protein